MKAAKPEVNILDLGIGLQNNRVNPRASLGRVTGIQ